MQIDPNGWNAAGGGTNSLSPGITGAAGWGLEAILTMTLVFVVYAAVDAERGANTAHLPVRADLWVPASGKHACEWCCFTGQGENTSSSLPACRCWPPSRLAWTCSCATWWPSPWTAAGVAPWLPPFLPSQVAHGAESWLLTVPPAALTLRAPLARRPWRAHGRITGCSGSGR